MGNKDQKAALGAIATLLRPLIRILIRLNIPFGSFAEAARQAYVHVAQHDFRLAGKKQTNARIAVLTGLSRKEVLRIQRLPETNENALNQRFNRCARVISGWLQDIEFCRSGKPLPLSQEDDEPSFRTLVSRYSGDMPARAVMDELLRVGAIDLTENQQVRLNRAAFVPSAENADKLTMLGNDVADLISTIDHNLEVPAEQSRFQLKVDYDNLSEEAAIAFRRFADQQSMALLQRYDHWLAQHDRDIHHDLPGQGRYRIGVGLFYFQEALESATTEETRS